MLLLHQSMKWILNQLCSTALLPCSQLKNQDFLHCLPETVSWRNPNQLNVQSCHTGEHSTQQLGEETQECHMNGGVKRKGRGNPTSKHLPIPKGSQTLKRGQKLSFISRNWCSISVASLNNPTSQPHQHHQCPEDNPQQLSFLMSPEQGIDYIGQSLAVVRTHSPVTLQFSSTYASTAYCQITICPSILKILLWVFLRCVQEHLLKCKHANLILSNAVAQYRADLSSRHINSVSSLNSKWSNAYTVKRFSRSACLHCFKHAHFLTFFFTKCPIWI